MFLPPVSDNASMSQRRRPESYVLRGQDRQRATGAMRSAQRPIERHHRAPEVLGQRDVGRVVSGHAVAQLPHALQQWGNDVTSYRQSPPSDHRAVALVVVQCAGQHTTPQCVGHLGVDQVRGVQRV